MVTSLFGIELKVSRIGLPRLTPIVITENRGSPTRFIIVNRNSDFRTFFWTK